MNLRSLTAVLLTTGLIFSTPLSASEDSAEYPFPDGFNFDDLPDIETETPAPAESPAETPAETPEQEDVPAEKSAPKTDNPSLLPATKYQPATGQVSSSGKTVSQPTDRIFIPNATDEKDEKDAFDKEKTLTETLKEDNQTDSKSKNIIEGTWVEKLTTSNPLSMLTSGTGNTERKTETPLEEMVKNARNKDEKGKSNAAVFDISGVMLRMNLQQVERTLENRGFRKINAKFQIPNFIKWRNEETCRTEGVVGYERLEACVINKAKKDKHQYLQYLKYAKYDSKEEIEVYFTSNFTENKVYKIVYDSRIADITGNSPKAVYIRNIKVYDFWKKMNQKYGHPDNKTNVTWGLGGNKPFLKASTGHLLLEDPMFREMDYTRMSREDQRFINSDFYNF